MPSSVKRHEFDYVERPSAVRNQLNCLCGMGACRFFCRRCPPVRESTSTISAYIILLIVEAGIMTVMMSHTVQESFLRSFPNKKALCEWLGAGPNCRSAEPLGYMTVYRLGLAGALFHLLLTLATSGVKTSKDCRAGLHNGMWLYKIIVLLGFIIMVFLIPDPHDYFIYSWLYIAMTGAAVFTVFQLVLLIFMVYSWTDQIVKRVSDGGSACFWYAVFGPAVAMLCFTVSAGGICILFIYFAYGEGCHQNQWFIFVNAGSCFIVSLVAAFKKDSKPVGLRLMHAALVSLYVTYLTWSAISSAPRKYQQHVRLPLSLDDDFRSKLGIPYKQDFYCGPHEDRKSWSDDLLPYVSFVILFIFIIKGTVAISRPNRCQSLELTTCPAPQLNPDTVIDDSGGQVLIRDEKHSVVYSYSLFHVMLGLATLLMTMNLTSWYTPNKATLVTFGRSWSAVWIKITSSWICLLIYFISVLSPTILPSKRSRRSSVVAVEVNGHAVEDNDPVEEAAVPLAPAQSLPFRILQETTV